MENDREGMVLRRAHIVRPFFRVDIHCFVVENRSFACILSISGEF